MDVLKLTTTDFILESVVSAFTANGYTSLKSTNKKESKNHNTYYFSLKKEKKTIRFHIYHSIKDDELWFNINNDSRSLVEKHFTVSSDKKTLTLNIKGVEDRIAELAEAHAEIVEGRKLQSFKIQLVIPYIQGKLDELGFYFHSHKTVGTKHVYVTFKLKESDGRRFELSSINTNYKVLNNLDTFEDWPFRLTFSPTSWSTVPLIEGSLSEIFRALTKWEAVNAEVQAEVNAARKKYQELLEARTKLDEEMRPYQKIINSAENLRIVKLKQISKEIDNGDSSSTQQ